MLTPPLKGMPPCSFLGTFLWQGRRGYLRNQEGLWEMWHSACEFQTKSRGVLPFQEGGWPPAAWALVGLGVWWVGLLLLKMTWTKQAPWVTRSQRLAGNRPVFQPPCFP